ncbi:hypothetical protein ABHA01_02200 [Clostridium paraputrificum]|uniref:hypothetical protein n=1 Tax=Clostridium paraputrificum TaxID=29363 RepID=UPI00325B69D5
MLCKAGFGKGKVSRQRDKLKLADNIYKESNPMPKNEFINILEDNHCISILADENNKILGLCMASIKEV